MRNKKVILSSILSLVLCFSLIVGGTFALFTSESKTNIAVTSGEVKVVATIEDFKMYSLNNISMVDFTGEEIDRTVEGTFLTGGTATVTDKAEITLDKIVPGDRVEFNIMITNSSNVAVKYRTLVTTTEDTGLFDGLAITINGKTFNGSSILDWDSLNATQTGEIKKIPVVVELPASALNKYQKTSAKLNFTVEAVQGNAETLDGCAGGAHTIIEKYDLAQHWEECAVCEYISEKVAHAMSTNDCTLEGTCSGCAYVRAAGAHTWNAFTYTDTDHHRDCATCDMVDEGAHTMSTTVSADGLTDTHYCADLCGYTYDDVYAASVNGNRYTDFAEAMSNVNDGDVVTILAGTYADDIAFDKAATYNGNGNAIFTGNVTVGSGATVNGCTFAAPMARTATNGAVTFVGNGVTFEGNTFDGVDLVIDPTNNYNKVNVKNNEFKNANLSVDYFDTSSNGISESNLIITGNEMNGGEIIVKDNSKNGASDIHVRLTASGNANAVYKFYYMKNAVSELEEDANATYYSSVDFGVAEGTVKVLDGTPFTAESLASLSGEALSLDENGMATFAPGDYMLVYTDENGATAYKIAHVENRRTEGAHPLVQNAVLVANADDMKALATRVNGGDNCYDTEFYLTADVDLNNEEWTPIGNTTNAFGGNFYGQNHTISNLKITGGANAALFGYIRANAYTNYLAGIEDLTIENVNITGATNAAAFVAGGRYTERNTWYGGVQHYHNLTLKGDVVIEGANAAGVLGNDWFDVKIAATNIVVDVNAGSYISGTTQAAGVFAGVAHADNVENVTSNIDVKGATAVGGIATKAGWNWNDITCSGNVSLTTEAVEGPYSIGTIFGSIADNTYWVNNFHTDYIKTYDDLINMTNLSATGTLTINENTASNGTDTNMIGTAIFTIGDTFNYVEGEVVKVEPAVAE